MNLMRINTHEKYGINNVRGGSYPKIKLSNSNVENLKLMLKTANDQCYICGSETHYAKECKKLKIKDEKCTCITSVLSPHRKSKCLLNKIFNDENDDIDVLKDIFYCERCGRNNHNMDKCYAKTHFDGRKL